MIHVDCRRLPAVYYIHVDCRKVIESGSKGHDGKRQRYPSKLLQSPYEQNARRKRVKKSLFGANEVLIDTNAMTPAHIEAAVIFIQTVIASEKQLKDSVCKVKNPGDVCTAKMLQDILHHEWLDGA